MAAISWPPPLISQLFSPRLSKATPFFHRLAVLCGFHLFLYFIRPQLLLTVHVLLYRLFKMYLKDQNTLIEQSLTLAVLLHY